MILVIGGAGAVGEHQTFETAVVCFSHGGVHTDVGRDPRQDEIANSPIAQYEFEVCRTEGTLSRFVDDDFIVVRGQFRDDLPACLPPNEDAPARACIADPGADAL